MQYPPRVESVSIEQHYASKKSMALAYLMTIGSKALVLNAEDVSDKDENRRASIQKSFDDEASIKRTMIREENLQKFKCIFCVKPGLSVVKVISLSYFKRNYPDLVIIHRLILMLGWSKWEGETAVYSVE